MGRWAGDTHVRFWHLWEWGGAGGVWNKPRTESEDQTTLNPQVWGSALSLLDLSAFFICKYKPGACFLTLPVVLGASPQKLPVH